MNERIKLLAEQTHVYAGGHSIFCHESDIKKFAELIVQRTLAIIESHAEIFQSDQARAMVEHIKSSVKTDFGVEE
jgi:hypothetical protein